MTGKFLAVTEQRHDARIVSKCRRRLLLNLNDRCRRSASRCRAASRSRESKDLVLGIRRSFRQNLGGFVESTLRLEGQCLLPECGLVPG